MRTCFNRLAAAVGVACLLGWFALAAPAADPPAAKPAADAAPGNEALFRALEKKLTGAEFVGHFTMTGRAAKLEEERYTIVSARKLPEGDLWLFNARIRYGGKDLTVPIPLEVKWAGKTPVITLDAVGIPGLGTFDSRVLIEGDRYAGTWQHDAVGGHLFGRIERPAAPAKAPE